MKIIPLGGLGEIGKNMMALEYANDIVVIDAGLMFPTEEMPGVDLVVPDISYLLGKQQSLRGIVITHGHEDHTGALPYILPRLALPVYATKLTERLISIELRQRGARSKANINVVHPGSKITLGSFTIEFFSVCHSIPDSVGLIIRYPEGVIVHTGDFKLDHTPVLGQPTDLNLLAQLGTQGVLLLLSDSTYVELPGYTPSERVVGEALDHIVARASGRVIITTFASLISRIQQVIDAAARHNRRVFVTGHSMKEIVKVASKMGYITIPPGIFCNFDELRILPHSEVILLTTGSQGEPTSALVRMARQEHGQIQIVPGDTVVMSATPIPGNEALVNRTIDSLFRQGAEVFYDKLTQVHVHGHGSQEELKLLLNIVKPKFFIPVHGEYRHLSLHAKLAESLGVPKDNIFVLEDGDILELGKESGRVIGKAPVGDVYIDGSMTHKLDGAVLRDRKLLAQDGVVVITVVIDTKRGKPVGRPCIVTRGFVRAEQDQELIEKCSDYVMAALDHDPKCLSERSSAEVKIRDSSAKFLYGRTRRHPIIIPVTIYE